jgi:DNA-directed RNA polymerase subunit RPC12/RpoP
MSRAEMIQELQAEKARLLQWVADLQSGMYVNCVYCGHRYGPKDKVPASMADVLKAHLATCPRHPMSEAVKGCKMAYHTLQSVLAVREGVPDEMLSEQAARLAKIVLDTTGERLLGS